MLGTDLGLGGKFLEMIEERFGRKFTTIFILLIALAVCVFALRLIYKEAILPLTGIVKSVWTHPIDWSLLPPLVVASSVVLILFIIGSQLFRYFVIRKIRSQVQGYLTDAETSCNESGSILEKAKIVISDSSQLFEEHKREREQIEEQYQESHDRSKKEIEIKFQEGKMQIEKIQEEYRKETDAINQRLDSSSAEAKNFLDEADKHLKKTKEITNELKDKLPPKAEIEQAIKKVNEIKDQMPPMADIERALEVIREMETKQGQPKT